MNKKVIRTVSALLYTDNGEILLHKHPKFGVFLGFGGKLEENEYELQAIGRELFEETNLLIDFKFEEEQLDYQRFRMRKPDDIVRIELDSGDSILIDHVYFIRVSEIIRQTEIITESSEIEFDWYDMKTALSDLEMFSDTRRQIREIYLELEFEKNMVSW